MPFYTVDKEFIYRKLLSEVYIRTYYEYKEKYFQESLWYNLNTTERTTFWRMCNAYILLHYLKKTNMIKKAQLHSVYAIFFLLTMPIYRPSWIHVCKVYPLHQCIFMTFWIMTSTICFFFLGYSQIMMKNVPILFVVISWENMFAAIALKMSHVVSTG